MHSAASRRLTKAVPVIMAVWIIALTIVAGLSKVGCSLQGSEDFAQFLLGLWRPTPFFPGSNRMGALLPLLTFPIRTVIWNANAQMLLRVLAAYIAAYSAVRLLTRFHGSLERSLSIAFGTFFVSLIVTLQFTSSGYYVAFISAHTYLLACACLFASFCFLWKTRTTKGWLIGTGGLLVAYWVNFSVFSITAFFLLVLIVMLLARKPFRHRLTKEWLLRAWQRGLRHPVIKLAALLSCATLAFGLANAASYWYASKYPQLTRSFSTLDYTTVHLNLWSVGIAFNGLVKETGGLLFLTEAIVCFVVIGIRTGVFPLKLPRTFLPFTTPETETGLLIAAVIHVVLVSQSAHAQGYDLNFRFFLVSALALIFLVTSFTYGLLRWVASRFSSDAAVVVGIFAMVALPGSILTGVAAKYQLPDGLCFTPNGKQWERDAEMVAAGNYDAVVGSYWDVWPLAFYRTALAETRGNSERGAFPTSYRSELIQEDILAKVRRDLAQRGAVRILCAPPGAQGADVRGLDCRGLIRWGQNWGTLPGLGLIGESLPLALPGRLQEIVASPPLLVEGREVGFKLSQEGTTYEFSGWSPPEGFGSWTLGNEAELFFTLDRLPSIEMTLRTQVVTDVGNFVVPGRFIAVEVLMNDSHVATWTFNPDSQRNSLHIPRQLLHVGTANFLKFRIYEPHSGKELGFSPTDLRQLGFALASICWDNPA